MESPGRISVLLLAVFLSACGGVDPFDVDDVVDEVEGRSCVDAGAEIPEEECIGLVFLFASTVGPNWTNNIGWGENNRPCSWFGVTCVDGHVSSVSLESNGLAGSLPSQLRGLGAITILELGDNQLTGPIPSEIGGMIFLNRLNLRDNQLTGTIPPELGNLGNLRVLALRNNQLAGPIPSELGNLRSLVFLNLSGNQLTGAIPSELGNLSFAQFLLLEGNQFGGVVPLPVADLGGRIQSSFSPNQCRFQSNPGLFVPDTQDYMDADRDSDGFICGIALLPPS